MSLTFKSMRKNFETELEKVLLAEPYKEVHIGMIGADITYPAIYVQLRARNLASKTRGVNTIDYHWLLEYDIYTLHHAIENLPKDTYDFTDDVVERLMEQAPNTKLFNLTICQVLVGDVEFGLTSISTKANEEPLYAFGGKITLSVELVSKIP